jgi:hypothetical protein
MHMGTVTVALEEKFEALKYWWHAPLFLQPI